MTTFVAIILLGIGSWLLDDIRTFCGVLLVAIGAIVAGGEE